MLETYRECLRDAFDLRGLKDILRQVARRQIRIHTVETRSPSPFAASLLFTYTANFLYNGDAPLAERCAATLALDHVQLRELLGDAQLRELLDPEVIDHLTIELQRKNQNHALREADALHDLLRFVGDLSQDELSGWPTSPEFHLAVAIDELTAMRRIAHVSVAGQRRLIAAEDAGRYRDGLGCVLPPGLPTAFLEQIADPLAELVSRFARTHVPFTAEDVARRFGLGVGPVEAALRRLSTRDRVLEGEFLPGGMTREWCDVEVLRKIKRRSLAKLRSQIEPVEPARFARFLSRWQGLDHPRRGLDGVLDVMEQLQGLPLPFSEWESAILPARIHDYHRGQLDELCAAGELAWRGFGAVGTRDGRVAFYLADAAERLAPPPDVIEDELDQAVYDVLAQNGACFFDSIAGRSADSETTSWPRCGGWCGPATSPMTPPPRCGHFWGAARSGRAAAGGDAARFGLAAIKRRWVLTADGRSGHNRGNCPAIPSVKRRSPRS